MSNNFLNPRSNFSCVDNAYTTPVMPANYPAHDTRYDIVMPGMRDCENGNILVIDSSCRNHTDYPEPNKYSITLDPPYKEVTKIELINADIPNKGYIIDSTHNKIHFQETNNHVTNGTYLTAEVPIGNYEIGDLCTAVETALDAASTTGATYDCTRSTLTDKITITQTPGVSTDLFNMLFQGKQTKVDPPSYKTNGVYTGKYKSLYKTGTIAPVLGFKRENYTGETEYVSDYTYNLRVYKYISLFVNREHTVASLNRVDSINDHVSGAFVVIPLDTTINNFQLSQNYVNDHAERFLKVFSSPIGEVNQIDIEFRDSDGNLFNFNGHDHMLVFQIDSQTRIKGYNEK